MHSLTVVDVLERAASLIEPEGAWTQGAFSRNDDGSCDDKDNTAASAPVCWCAMGAIAEVAGVDPNAPFTWSRLDNFAAHAYRVLREVPEVALATQVEVFNDATGRKQSEVVAALRKAATLARETSK